MKRIITALLFALILLPAAHAAPDSYCKTPDASYVHTGQHTAFDKYNIALKGWFVYWWCEDGTYQWVAFTPDAWTGDFLTADMAYRLGVNPGFENVGPVPPDNDPLILSMGTAVYALVVADTHRPPPPPKQQWVVQKNGSYQDRPSYPVTASGVRSTKSDGRAAIVQPNGKPNPCVCDTPIVEGKTTYCKFILPTSFTWVNGANVQKTSTSVAVCSKAAP